MSNHYSVHVLGSDRSQTIEADSHRDAALAFSLSAGLPESGWLIVEDRKCNVIQVPIREHQLADDESDGDGEHSSDTGAPEAATRPARRKRAVTVDKSPVVYRDAGLNEPFDEALPANTEIEVSSPAAGSIAVACESRSGFIRSDAKTRILPFGYVTNARGANAHAEPSAQSAVTHIYQAGDELLLLETLKTPKGQWVKIRDEHGDTGYVYGDTDVLLVDNLHEYLIDQKKELVGHAALVKFLTKKNLPLSVAEKLVAEAERDFEAFKRSPERKKAPRNEALLGLFLIFGGIIATAWSYSEGASGSGGGRYFVFYGAIIWGLYHLVKGMCGL